MKAAAVNSQVITSNPLEAPYRFDHAFPPDHLVHRFAEYAAEGTDAAIEYHEANGLSLISAALPGVRAELAPYPNGLPVNLYVLLLGDSTVSRKSTSNDIRRDVQVK